MRTAHILCTSLLLLLGLPVDGEAQDQHAVASLHLAGVPLRSGLDTLMKRFSISIVYLDRDVKGKTGSVSCSGCMFEEAIHKLLEGTPLSWLRIGNQIILRETPAVEHSSLTTVWGTVTDSRTGEWISGATVVIRSASGDSPPLMRWCPANQFGFYSLRRLPPGSYVLSVRALGYRQAFLSFAIPEVGPVRQDFALTQEEISMQEVTVEGRGIAARAGEGLSRGVYFRCTPSDQNQYLLDGARIYSPSHFGGLLDTFDAEVLNDVQTVAGGIPPYYGGRIGGILDLSMREGSLERFAGSAGTGSLGSHLSFEGPVASGTSFLVSARRGYPEPLVPALRGFGSPSHLGSTEVTAKLSHRLSGSSRIFLGGFFNGDSYSNQVEGAGGRLNNTFSWGNGAANLRWIGIVSPSIFLHASAVFTRYSFSLVHAGSGPAYPVSPFTSDYSIEDFSVRAHAEQFYDEDHTVRGGVELIRHRTAGTISEVSSQVAGFALRPSATWEMSVYLQDQWRILPRVTAEFGGRATSFTGPQGSFSGVDPRFSLLYSLSEETRLYGSLTSINEFLHPFRNSGVFLFYPVVFWYPSTDQARPSTSLQVTVGVEKESDQTGMVLSAESFYRVAGNIHEAIFPTGPQTVQDVSDVMVEGTGRSYGIVLSARKRTGGLTGSVCYRLSWESDTFPGLNGGEPFTPLFDRRHELQVDASYTPGENWTLGALCVLATNQSTSLMQKGTLPFTARAEGQVQPSSLEPFDLSGARLPGFQRLELRVVRRFSAGGFPCQLTLRLLNAYGLVDPISWELRQSGDPRLLWTAGLDALRIFPLFPALGLTVRF